MSNKITPEIEQQILYLAANGEGIKSISRIINIPRSTLRLFIVKNGVILKDARHNKASTKIDSQTELKIREMAFSGIIATKIAEEIGLHEGTIRTFCKKKNIALTLGNEKGFLTKVTPEIEQQIIALAEYGLNATDIAKKIGTISKSTVQNYAKDNNLDIAKNKERDPEYLKLQDDFEKLMRSGYNFTETRIKLGISYKSAYIIAKKCNILDLIRTRKEAAQQDKALSFDFVKTEIEKIGYKLLSTEYLGSKYPIIVQCDKGHEPWKTIWNSIDQGQRCPKCSCTESRPQKEMTEFIRSIYSGTVLENDWDILGDREADIWLPELKIAIEHDGLIYHSKKWKKNPEKDNRLKMERTRSLGIKLLCFFGDEWSEKKDLIKSIIKNKIGAISNKIYARNTEFVEIANKEAKEFLNTNHLEGYTQCSKSFGLKHEGKLVMCLTLRRSKGKIWEIARMATLMDYAVVGGASKLFKHMPRPLMTYSDNRISDGQVYSVNGFEEITKSIRLSYWYTDFRKRVFRTQCQKIKDLPGTEEEQALAGAFSQKRFGHNKPLFKIFGYGQRKWLLK